MTKQLRSQRLASIRRDRRRKHVRKKVSGTAAQPRLSVFRSCKQIYVQAVDDVSGVTLAAASSMEKALQAGAEGTKTQVAKAVGQEMARRLLENGVSKAVFDRGWYKYHGRVKALADGAREGGLKF